MVMKRSVKLINFMLKLCLYKTNSTPNSMKIMASVEELKVNANYLKIQRVIWI